MEAAFFSITLANSYFVLNLSPVAIGIEVLEATKAIESMLSGGTGSSNHNGSYCSSFFARRTALEKVICPCVPNNISHSFLLLHF